MKRREFFGSLLAAPFAAVAQESIAHRLSPNRQASLRPLANVSTSGAPLRTIVKRRAVTEGRSLNFQLACDPG
jgi:hypothetical protein